MSATPVLMVLHNHQPVGNFPWVTEECYRTAYLPFLEVLARHPGIRIGLHITGPLFAWLACERPEYLARVRALVEAGQVEVLGGGFYEPILSVIPEQDRVGQLTLLRDTVARAFGRTPTGAWLAERVWEPGLPTVLQAAGVRYTLIDDEIFHRLGYPEMATCTTYLTEDQGATIRLLPISKRMRYTIPTEPVDEVLATMRTLRAEGAETIIYAEDGERFGNWPGTFAYLYGEEAYLDRLFTALEEADDLRFTLPGEYVQQTPPRDRVYLPPASYAEMMAWSGGFWRNFLTRYRESNLMHKKMCQVSRWVATAEQSGHEIAEAQRHLYAAQCNCAYWYGAFGGLYLPHLRRAVYAHLLQAERAVAPVLPPDARGACDIADHDKDGHDEIFLRHGALSVGIAPHRGGGVFAIEQLDAAHNFLATMARYPLRDDPALPQRDEPLPVDWYPRFAFLDHILGADATPEGMRDMRFRDLGDFVLGAYTLVSSTPASVTLARDGHFWDGPDFVPLSIEKQFRLADEDLVVSYLLHNTSSQARTFRFAVEITACVSAGDAPGRTLSVHAPNPDACTSLVATRRVEGAHAAQLRDDWLGVEWTVAWDRPASTWIFPIETPLRSLAGEEWVYQSTVLNPVWEVTLAPGEAWNLTIRGVVCAGVASQS